MFKAKYVLVPCASTLIRVLTVYYVSPRSGTHDMCNMCTGLLRIDTWEPVTYMFRADMIYVTCVPVYMRGVDRSQHCLHICFFVVPCALRVAVRTHDCLVVHYVCACHAVTRATRGVELTQDCCHVYTCFSDLYHARSRAYTRLLGHALPLYTWCSNPCHARSKACTRLLGRVLPLYTWCSNLCHAWSKAYFSTH
jgi:hypothetical protein